MIFAGKRFHFLKDHRGSVLQVIDVHTGEVKQKMVYSEFGEVLQDTNPGFQPFGFAGGLYDYETKLVRFGARDYDGMVGRWLSKDPIRFNGGDTNLYGYVLNDPVNYKDSSGLITEQEADCNKSITEHYWDDRNDGKSEYACTAELNWRQNICDHMGRIELDIDLTPREETEFENFPQ